ncbi:hypothetical protein SPBRAN_1355 [uncultured Candidatus Thioglobus sp.]|nr:hypothetical protein SPBRAN_1355 [uncultured Candidatus Thioglobus sp.]
MNNHQNTTFHQLGNFIKTCQSLTGTGFNKIPNLAKSVILLIIPIYAKVSVKYFCISTRQISNARRRVVSLRN